MLRWRFWGGRRDRLALALVGLITLAGGLSAIALLAEGARGTVTRSFEQTWRAPYDIVVHTPLPGGQPLPDLTEPNLLTTLPSGITMAQLATVRQVEGVALAAPIAVVGYVEAAGRTITLPSKEFPSPPAGGIYRLTSQLAVPGAATPESFTESYAIAYPDKAGQVPANLPGQAFSMKGNQTFGVPLTFPLLLVGVDPAAESGLVGLDSTLTAGRYFKPDETASQGTIGLMQTKESKTPIYFPRLPVLVNPHSFDGWSLRVTLAAEGQQGSPVVEQVWSGTDLFPQLMPKDQSHPTFWGRWGQSGPLHYERTASPFPDRWPTAVAPPLHTADPFTTHRDTTYLVGPAVRPFKQDPLTFEGEIIGQFDPTKLTTARDPQAHLPLMTYRPATATQVLDAEGRPLNPPRAVIPGFSPTSFLSMPPALLTSLPAAMALIGDGGINAIQIKVAGAVHLDQQSEARVRAIAQSIEAKTGLMAEVVMGSSPAPVLVRVPAATGGSAILGWFEETWIHKNAGTTAVQATEFGFTLYIVAIGAVALLYALATGVAGVTARRRDGALALALGWQPAALWRLASGEQLLYGLVAGLLACGLTVVGGAPRLTSLLVLGAGVLLYLPAAGVAGLAAARIPPGEALRWGDQTPGRRILPGTGSLSLALASLSGRPGRTVTTVAAMALPTALLVVLAFVATYLKGVLYTSMTGQYAALQVGPLQLAAVLVGLGIAAVAAYDLVRQNAIDHRRERALLHALGWPRWRIGLILVGEGGALGLLAGILGGGGGLLLLLLVYGRVGAGGWQAALLAAALPCLLGLMTGGWGALVEGVSAGRKGMAGAEVSSVLRLDWRTLLGALTLLLLMGAMGAGALRLRVVTAPAVLSASPGPEPAAPIITGGSQTDTPPPPPALQPKSAWIPLDPTPLIASQGRPEPAVRTKYNLQVQLDPTAMQLAGKGHVAITNNESKPLTQLVFHLYPNAPFFRENFTGKLERPGSLIVDSVESAGKSLPFQGATTEILTIDLPTPLAPGAAITVDLGYRATIPSLENRFGTNGRTIYLGQAYPILAIHDEGGWHVDRYMVTGDPFYADVADYDVTYTVPKEYQVAATGRPEDGPDQGRYHFTAERVREFGAAASASWERHDLTVDGVAIRYFHDKGVEAGDETLKGALAAISGSLHFFNQQFGPYPYANLTVVDQIGMEYPQFVMAGPDTHEIAHEIAHQWWYGVVGNDEVRQIWDEGLTEFSTLLYQAQTGAPMPTWMAHLNDQLAALRMDGTLYSYAAADDLGQASYAQVEYVRGWRLWEALRTGMGEEAFFRMLRDFYKAHQFGNATWADWRAAVLRTGGVKAVAIFDTYVTKEAIPANSPEKVAPIRP